MSFRKKGNCVGNGVRGYKTEFGIIYILSLFVNDKFSIYYFVILLPHIK